ncbi:c-type cytochrome [Bradyrhizobium sp.]|uniref:c-type cytochrome n=1 Tax=Bradyrhizobium sp. TaxID=376 RepID=UPI003C6EA8BD
MLRSVLIQALIALALAAPAFATSSEQRGRTFAQSHCAQCHATGRVGRSPLPTAPPFRTLHLHYPVESLAESLAEGIETGHPAMPEFQLDPDRIHDFLSYLKTLE